MQSGISVSHELQVSFNRLTSAGPLELRGIVATIEEEEIVGLKSVPSRSQDFLDDLEQLNALLEPDQAAYIILRRYSDAPDGFVAVTFVPDTASVRQKMLFASSRLALVRELGAERFRETIFATTKAELTPDGWRKHDQHGALTAPLTDEEETLKGVREAESEASRGTLARGSHVSSGLSLPVSPEALQALRQLPDSPENLIQLRIDVERESIGLASATVAEPGDLASQLPDSEPRFTFYRYEHETGEEGQQSSIVFMYTCPAGSIKERMLAASSRANVVSRASEDAGLVVARKLEAGLPAEVTAAVLHDEFHPRAERKQAFARPKRPGRVT